ncbi:MAG: ISKra4 family transposase, partial [Desulfobacterales bacterium]|nr:ISKra4 family transposase [Desulfobacterales bacterium]
ITGARWGLQGAEAVLKLRAVKISDDFPDYWKFYEQNQYIRNHRILYKNPTVLEN